MQSIKIPPTIKKIFHQITEHLTILVAVIAVVLITFVGIFLYQNFYMTIISAKKIIILQQEVAPGVIKNSLLDEIKTNYQNKQTLEKENWQTIEKIFATPNAQQEENNITQKSAVAEIKND